MPPTPSMTIPTRIETARLVLRPLAASNLDDLVRALNNFNIAKMTARIPHPYGIDDARAFLALCQTSEEGVLRLSIARRAAPDLVIGGVGYEALDEENAAEIGYWLAEGEWGQGLASEAASAVRDHAFRHCQFDRLIARYLADNPASGRVLAKLGFTVTGSLTCGSIADGDNPATAVALTRADWRARQGGSDG